MLDATSHDDPDDDDLDPVDREALRRAMRIAMTDPDRRDQLLSMLVDRPWVEVAAFAAYTAQIDEMDLRPWQNPPCFGIGSDADPDAKKWANRLTRAGLSIYEPAPRAALERAAKQRPPRNPKWAAPTSASAVTGSAKVRRNRQAS